MEEKGDYTGCAALSAGSQKLVSTSRLAAEARPEA
jgi:hypothetical protein